MSIFSIPYDSRKQKEFEDFLNKGELHSAYSLLESFPKGHTSLEKIDYSVVILEGYRALINRLLYSNPQVEELRKELSQWNAIVKKPEEVKDSLDELGFLRLQIDEYLIANPKDRKSKKDYSQQLEDLLSQLNEYKGIGSREDIDRELKDLRKLVSKLEKL